MSLTYPISRKWYWISALVGIPILAFTLFQLAKTNPNSWWFFITLLATTVVSDAFDGINDKLSSLTKRQGAIPVKFLGFVDAKIAAAVAGAYVVSEISQGIFKTPLPTAGTVFLSCCTFLPVFIFGDFILTGKFRRIVRIPLDDVELVGV